MSLRPNSSHLTPPRGSVHSRVTAVLGPTNTGKTYLAIERMMGHVSGMMGFPLRLLARENYDRVVAIKGVDAVALVTGEEKILPPNPSYFLCTVESMPLTREVAFLAVDEVQLAADPDRGHIFTDRIINARGYAETMLLGADTIAPFIRALVPGCEFVARPRFSSLTYAGIHKITRLPARSAVVAFSAASVYGIAELLRRQRGGAAVVMGALSPRTRNAQVAMFQNGEVDYLVATDAIGMGLNMDVAHVAFGELAKFDGRRRRALSAAELGQIAGRAGRHMSDGTFGTTVEAGELAPELIAAIEGHNFEKVRSIYWRNSDLRFDSIAALTASLDQPSPMPAMVAVRDAPDHLALNAMIADGEAMAAVVNADDVRRLWDVCQIPDFRRAASASHARFLGGVWRRLAGDRRLPDDWIGRHIAMLDRADGDIDTLTGRIDHIRTWTYISQRADWLNDAGHWQGITRAVEDKLSDALHDRLTQRFVDRRTTALVKGLKAHAEMAASVAEDGAVAVEGHVVGRLDGFRFVEAPGASRREDSDLARKAVRGAAARALRPEIARRLDLLGVLPMPGKADETGLVLGDDARITWRGALVGQLSPGRDALSPVVRAVASEVVEAREQVRLAEVLQAWLDAHLRARLVPLFAVKAGAGDAVLPSTVRGILYQLAEGLGCIARAQVDVLARECDGPARKALARLGLRFGIQTVYIDGLHAAGARRLRAVLDGVYRRLDAATIARHAGVVGRGAPAFARDGAVPDTAYLAAGLVALGPRVFAAPRTESLAAEVRKLARQGAFAPTPLLRKLVGGSVEDLVGVLLALGFRAEEGPAGIGFAPGRKVPAPRKAPVAKDGLRPPKRGGRRHRRDGRKDAAPSDSPFAVLANLKLGPRGKDKDEGK